MTNVRERTRLPHKRVEHVRWLLVVLLLALTASTVGCGESDAEKAQDEVCDARADLEKRIDDLAGLTPTAATVGTIEDDLNAIEKDLEQIRDAQGDLGDERRREVESANQEFSSELETVADDLGSELSLSEAAAKVDSAAADLASSYEQTLATIDCE